MRHTIIPAVHLFIIRDGKISLARRCNTGWWDGSWSVIAWHVEEHEMPIEAMIREAREEAGIDLIGNIQCIHSMYRTDHHGDRIDFFFMAEEIWGEIVIQEPDKCDGIEWFDLQNLPKNIIPYILQAITLSQQGITYSQRDERL